jgi:menaquinone-dependent protoporphyrinogen oxidase
MTPAVLVLFGTTDGQTARIAAAIGGSLESKGLKADVVHAGSGVDPRPEDYGAVIVAASIIAGGYQKAVRRWVRAHATALHERPNVFVSVCLSVVTRTPKVDRDLAAILERFSTQTGWRPHEVKVVAGALKYTKYGWFKRWMMRRIVAKAGGDTDTSRDYEYTDWDDLREFTHRFAAGVPQVSARHDASRFVAHART